MKWFQKKPKAQEEPVVRAALAQANGNGENLRPWEELNPEEREQELGNLRTQHEYTEMVMGMLMEAITKMRLQTQVHSQGMAIRDISAFYPRQNPRGSDVAADGTMALAQVKVETKQDPFHFYSNYRRRHKATQVLSHVSADFPAGKVTAILGGTHAGKTTLLEVLATGTSMAHVRGRLYFEGKEMLNNKSCARLFGLVREGFTMYPMISVEEYVWFYATLYGPTGEKKEAKQRRIRHALQTTGLAAYSEVRCGGVLPGGHEVPGLTPGQKRRLVLAGALVAEFPVIFLDNPSASLTPMDVELIMLTMRVMAQLGFTVVFSTHHVAASSWRHVNHVLLLSLGRVMYTGAPGGMTPWLTEGLQEGYAITQGADPCEFAVHLVTVGHFKPENVFGKRTMHKPEDVLRAAYKWRTQRGVATRLRLAVLRQAVRSGAVTAQEEAPVRESSSIRQKPRRVVRKTLLDVDDPRASLRQEVKALVKRTFLVAVRDPTHIVSRLLAYLCLGLLIGLLFLLPFTSIALHQNYRMYYRRERKAMLYSCFAYHLAQSTLDGAVGTAAGFLIAFPAFFLCGLNSFGLFLNPFMFTSATAAQLMQVICLITSNGDIAFAIGAVLTFTFQLTTGYYVLFREMPSAAANMQWISPQRYGFAAALQIQFENVSFYYYNLTGQDLLALREYESPTYAGNVGILIAMLFALHGITGIALMVVGRPNHPLPLEKEAITEEERLNESREADAVQNVQPGARTTTTDNPMSPGAEAEVASAPILLDMRTVPCPTPETHGVTQRRSRSLLPVDLDDAWHSSVRTYLASGVSVNLSYPGSQ